MALREDVEVFSETLRVTVAFFEPEEELNVHQILSLVIDQLVLELMVKVPDPLTDSKDMLLLFNCNVALASA